MIDPTGSQKQLSNECTEQINNTGPTDHDQALQRAYRKIDLRLLAWYSGVLALLRINAHNITNAAILNREAGTDIQRQLGDLDSEQWALVLSVFFYPFVLLEPFSSLMLKLLGPRKWMSGMMLAWGAISVCQASTVDFRGLIICRVLLGVAEAGLFPSVLYHLSFWYPASYLPLRIAALTACCLMSGLLSGLLGYAVSFMNGKGGLSGWQWLFILEGLPTCLCGVYTAFTLPEYPQTVTFLRNDERAAVLAAMPESQPALQKRTWDTAQVRRLLKDPVLYLFMAVWALHSIGARGITIVLPTVILELGISGTAVTQLMSMPAYFFGCALFIAIAYAISTRRLRSWPAALGLMAVTLACYVALVCIREPVAKYVTILLAMTSSMGIFPILWPECIKAIDGTTATALAIGATSAAAHLEGIVGPHIYQQSFGPTYRVSYVVSLAMLAANIFVVLVTWRVMNGRSRASADSSGSEEAK